ncbi:hypothetical protein RFZ44_08825, partial [Acinetobacter sp. 163]|nr:hypothetical protein [Acinetobacter sp. 163]
MPDFIFLFKDGNAPAFAILLFYRLPSSPAIFLQLQDIQKKQMISSTSPGCKRNHLLLFYESTKFIPS